MTLNQKDKNEFLKTVIYAAKEASKVILKSNQKTVKTYKAKTDLVTSTDHESERVIIDIIRSKHPDHSILAEESGNFKKHLDYNWIIDPLDGTTNFVHSYPLFGVSIALSHKDKIIVGVVVELPSLNVYSAIQNGPAYCNDKIIKVSDNNKLIDSLLVTGFGYEHGNLWEDNMKLFKIFTDITQGVRRSGAAAVDICHAASGKTDGYWEFDIKPWDIAAGSIIAKQAGALITGIRGEEFSIWDNQILATNGKIHGEMLKIITSTI